MFKLSLYDPCGYLKQSYGQKKGRESNWQFDSRPLKVKNHFNLFVCRLCATYHWKDFDEVYDFASYLISIKIFIKSYGPPKFWESQFRKFWDSKLGSPETKWHLGAGPWPNTKNIIRGKVVAPPKFGSWWVLWVHVYSWFVHAPKVL